MRYRKITHWHGMFRPWFFIIPEMAKVRKVQLSLKQLEESPRLVFKTAKTRLKRRDWEIDMAMGQNLWYHIWVVIHIHLPAILMFTRGTGFWPITIYYLYGVLLPAVPGSAPPWRHRPWHHRLWYRCCSLGEWAGMTNRGVIHWYIYIHMYVYTCKITTHT